MLKPVQESSRAQLSEQSCAEDEEIVLLAGSNAHIPALFFVFLGILYDVTFIESVAAEVAMIIIIAISVVRSTGDNILHGA